MPNRTQSKSIRYFCSLQRTTNCGQLTILPFISRSMFIPLRKIIVFKNNKLSPTFPSLSVFSQHMPAMPKLHHACCGQIFLFFPGRDSGSLKNTHFRPFPKMLVFQVEIRSISLIILKNGLSGFCWVASLNPTYKYP